MTKTPSPETIAAARQYVTGKPGAKRQCLWNASGEWNPKRDSEGRLINRPREYWTPVVRVGGKTYGVVGPNPDGTSGAPIGYLSRKDAIANAERFLDQCRAILAEVSA